MTAINGTSPKIRKVLVLGDNRLATSIISGLSQNNTKLEIHQSTRSGSVLESTIPNLTIHKLSSEESSQLTSLFNSLFPDIIFSTKSPGSFPHQKALIDSAIGAGIKKFVACEWGLDSLNVQIQERLPPYKERAKTVAYLREISSSKQQQKKKGDGDGDGEEVQEFSWLAIATGTSLEQSLLDGNLGFDIPWQSATIHGSGDESFAASSTAWPGKISAAIIEKWEECKNSYLYAAEFLTTSNSILEEFRTQTGREWIAGKVDVEDTIREAEGRFERGFPDAGMVLMERSVLFDGSLEAGREFVEEDAKGLLGLEGERLGDVVKRVLHDFEHHGKGGCGCD